MVNVAKTANLAQNPGGVRGGGEYSPFTKTKNAHAFGLAFPSQESTEHILKGTPSDMQKASSVAADNSHTLKQTRGGTD